MFAAVGGHLACLKFAFDSSCTESRKKLRKSKIHLNSESIDASQHAGAWSIICANAAAYHGHLHILKYLRKRGCKWNTITTKQAARGGSIECLKYLLQHGCPCDARACSAAAREGRLACLQFLHKNNIPWDEKAYAAAALEGKIMCLKYLHENGCPWDETTCANAVCGATCSASNTYTSTDARGIVALVISLLCIPSNV